MALTQAQENFAAAYVETGNASGDAPIKMDIVFGRVELRSWFVFVGDKMVGMGSKTVYDEHGAIVSSSSDHTGLVARFC